MIKGCHKSIVFLKNTESELFDEAYLILKPNARSKNKDDIISEATRLVNSLTESKKRRKKVKGHLLTFLSGSIFGMLIALTVYLII